jgi:hypothetical protein
VVYDPNNCGGCGIVCESGSCPGGACAPVDACGGLTNCGGVCVDTTSDRYNCGGCGNFCEYGCNPGDDLGTCVNGACGYGC